MTFIIGNFQFHCKSEHKQVQRNKIIWDMCKSDSIFPYLQSSTLSVNVKGNWTHLAEKNSQPGTKINTNFRLS